MTFVIALVFAGIVAALLFAGVAMVREGREGAVKSPTMWRALAVRVGLSVALFLFILVAYKLGWIHPTDLPLG